MSAVLEFQRVLPLPGGFEIWEERPIPEGCDLKGFDDMKLSVHRLRESKAWKVIAKRDPRLGFYMMNLWMAGWMNTPPGSLPNDDEELCEAAMCDPAVWPEVRMVALRHWKLWPGDGRLYHPFLCQKVAEAWASKVRYRNRGKAGGEATAAARRQREAQTAHQLLGTEGADMLVALTGRAPEGAAAMIGQMRKLCGDDVALVLNAIRKAYRKAEQGHPVADPASWIMGAVRNEARSRQQPARGPQPKRVDADMAFFDSITGGPPMQEDPGPYIDGYAED